MKKLTYRFSGVPVDYYLDHKVSALKQITDIKHSVLITDQHIYDAYPAVFKGWNTIVLRAGEAYKVQATVDEVVEQLIALGADRKTTLVGIGGGVITDLTGYIASVYMRGIRFGFVPTSVLALVDASIGGKNGIDVGVYKNMVGIIRQPSFLLHDLQLLRTLPVAEWQNGFAEIIKHACIKDAKLFRQLQEGSLDALIASPKKAAPLIERNVRIKSEVVRRDETEQGERKLLNFGHTLGHALENQYELSHGQAVSIGMTYACHLSEKLKGFKGTEKVVQLLEQYGLPTYASFDADKAMEVLTMDKKRERKQMNYILLEKIGRGVIEPIPVARLGKMIRSLQEL
ncbi:3-dehydroquinate synthase [Nostoc ellipsosporum NOK]|nr:3-dehydroquinate synthase [Nostoc ellipsosporum NOK]